MEQALYDEFGNYIGPAQEEELDAAELEAAREADHARGQAAMQAESAAAAAAASPSRGAPLSESERQAEADAAKRAVVLFEDRKIYPDASEVYPGAETLVMDEDIQPLSQPILAPAKTKNFHLLEKKTGFPAVHYNKDFLISLMRFPELIRNVAVVGHLHHGKSSLLDLLVQHTHDEDPGTARSVRYTDSLQIEQERGVSVKTHPISLVLPSSKGKSYLINLLDTPGHVNFSDEVSASLRLADAAVVVVDAVEGLMVQTDRVLRHAVAEHVRVCVCINKLDRLILELKLPPTEAYYKLRHTLDEINRVLGAASGGTVKVSPEEGTVCFASTLLGYCFSLESFAQLYIRHYASNSIRADDFARQLWGDIWFHPQDRTFRRQPPPSQSRSAERSFVQFVLAPLYKLHAQVVGEDQPVLQPVLEQLGIHLRPEQFNLDSRPLLKLVMTRFFGAPVGLVDCLVKNCPSPVSAAVQKVERLYTGSMLAPEALAMKKCDPEGPLLIYVTKLYPKPDCDTFEALGRVFSGTVRKGDAVRVLGEQYTPDDAEDMLVRDVTRLALPAARYRVDTESASAGNWVLLEGIDQSITKSATVVSRNGSDQFHIFSPLSFNTVSVVKIAVEPLNPSELPKMVDGLRKVNKSYPLLTTKVEESGEHVIFGTGELYLDCVMHDLRRMYSEIEVKVSDPSVSFCETVLETSQVKCYAVTPNKENKLTVTAEPLEKGIAEDIERGNLTALVGGGGRQLGPEQLTAARRAAQDRLQQTYDWDILAARRVWAFGPEPRIGPNVLINDTLPQQTNQQKLEQIRASVVQGFQWATREGPLCEEPIRNVKFRLLDATVAAAPLQRGSGQIIPTARRVAYSAFLTATPRLMEPVYFVEIQSPADAVAAIISVLTRRRGHMTSDAPKAGSPLYTVNAYLPVIESFGFETDLRSHTQGQAFCLSVFDHWAVVPGDPLDKNLVLRPLEIAPPPALAREFMVKTRRRKGLADDVSATKFFDEELLQALQSNPNAAGTTALL